MAAKNLQYKTSQLQSFLESEVTVPTGWPPPKQVWEVQEC